MTDLDLPATPDPIDQYRARCIAEGRAPADLSRALHPHALPSPVQARQTARQRVVDAERALDQAEHAEALAALATARARRVLAFWRERLAEAEGASNA